MVAVGPGARDRAGNLIPVSVKEGDNVLLPEFGGTQVKLGEKEYVFFFFLLCSVLVSLNLFSSFNFLCCCMLIYIYIVFWVLVCGFCCAGSFCTGMRISWALFMTDWFLAFNGILFWG